MDRTRKNEPDILDRLARFDLSKPRKCERCGKPYQPKVPKQKYCGKKCANQVTQERLRMRAKKYSEAVREAYRRRGY